MQQNAPGNSEATGQKASVRALTEPTLHDLARNAKTLLRRLGPGGPLALAASVLPPLGALTLVFTFNIVGPWLKAQGLLGVAIYVAGFTLCGGLALLPTHIQAALAGWAFGFATGLFAAVAGALGAALLGYAIALRATGDRAVQLIAEKPKWLAVYNGLLGGSFWRSLLIVTLVRSTLSPFALTNLIFAATRVNPLAYVLGTLIGISPRTGAAVFFAVGLHQVTSRSPHERWLWVLGLVLTLVAVAVIGRLANVAVSRVATSPPPGSATEPQKADRVVADPTCNCCAQAGRVRPTRHRT